MKKRGSICFYFLVVFMLAVGCGGGGGGDSAPPPDTNVSPANTASPPSSNVVTNVNYERTALLYGSWVFYYTILSNWTDYYYLSTIQESTVTPGDYNIFGTDEYGNTVIAGYSSKYGWWDLLDQGSIIDQFYVFYVDGATGADILPGSCYYQISHPSEKWSRCYTLSGRKFSTSAKVVTENLMSKLEVEKVHQNEIVEHQEPPAEILEQYNKLKRR